MAPRTKAKASARNSYLLRTYGITEKQYASLLKKQGSKCAVCSKPASEHKGNLHVDHDHKTNEIRGLLCSWCNHRIVGRHRIPDLLLSAGKYLSGPFTGWIVPPKKKRRKKRK